MKGQRGIVVVAIVTLAAGCQLVKKEKGGSAAAVSVTPTPVETAEVPTVPAPPPVPTAPATATPIATGATGAATAGAKKPPPPSGTATAPPAAIGGCKSSAECGVNEGCEDGKCVQKCAPSAVFIDTNRCSSTICKSDADCPSGKSCIPSAHPGVSACK